MPQILNEQQLAVLMKDLNPSRIASRSQGGRKLSYLESWDVRATLIRIFGFGGFDAEVLEAKVIHHEKKTNKQGNEMDAVSAQSTVRLHIKQLDATYTETAASAQSGSQGFGDVADFALKTSTSDALKRCAINLGTQFGLSLYNNGNTSEIIRTIVAPGQEHWLGQRNLPQNPQEVRQGVAENDVASTPPDDAQTPEGAAQPPAGAQPLSGAQLTPEQQAANQKVMEKLGRQVEQKETGENG